MDPLLLQQQLINNNRDLTDFCQDLKSWGEEMQKKESRQTQSNLKPIDKESHKATMDSNKTKIQSEETQVPKKKCMTYADWDKFDADKECEKVNDDSESELTDEFDESMKEEALLQKEKGNKFVKSGNWDEAIKCYTKAIDYFAYDPVFHANRALCYLKKQDPLKAEKDCSVSLKLDNTYVKAYQRRAAARESLGKFEDSKLDLLRVLELEPKNSESKNNLERLKDKIKQAKASETPNEAQRPISKFTASRQQKKGMLQKNLSNDVIQNVVQHVEDKIDLERPVTVWPSGDQIHLVKAIKKPPHLRCKTPLKRITIQETSNENLSTPEVTTIFPRKDTNSQTIRSDDLVIVEHQLSSHKEIKNLNNLDNVTKTMKIEELEIEKNSEKFESPKNSVQFHLWWKRLKGCNEDRYKYLKLLQPTLIPGIFKDSLESNVFSEILQVLTDYFIKNQEDVYDYLFYLTKTRRFKALTMFFTLNDKNCLWKMFNHIKEIEGRSKDEIDILIREYEL